HGAFEIKGVAKEVRDEFSRRTLEINQKIKELGVKSDAGKKLVTLATRDLKLNVADRGDLLRDWKVRAEALGFDGKPLHSDALARAAASDRPNFVEATQAALFDVQDRIGRFFRTGDPLVASGAAAVFMPADTLKAQHAVASAIRHLSEREAAFSPGDIVKAALGFQVKGLEVEPVATRISELLRSGALVAGQSNRADGHFDLVTTPDALKMEQTILDRIDAGQGQGRVIVPPDQVLAQLQEAAGDRPLNAGQSAAAIRILSGGDRSTLVQGVAGAGKSTMIGAVATAAAGQEVRILGLAFQNKMVADLKESGIEEQTIASFVQRFAGPAHAGSGPKFESAKAELKNTVILVDESSMVSSRDMLRLTEIAQALSLDGLHFIGDRQQLSAIEQGKSFAVAQAAGVPMVRMDENIRQRNSPLLLAVAGLSNEGFAAQALDLLAAHGRVTEDRTDHVAAAANMWLALSASDRERTAIFTAGRNDRSRINMLVQGGLLKEGILAGEGLTVTALQGVNNSREELRHASTYKAGQVLEARMGVAEIGLAKGSYAVTRIDARGRISVSDGRSTIKFDPAKLDTQKRFDRLSLSERVELKLHDGDTILWRDRDKARGLEKSTYAKILKADGEGVTVDLGGNRQLHLPVGDPMLARLDLGYALNAHMAQGITKAAAIEVIGSYQRNLATQRTQNVLNTRATDDVRVVTDDLQQLKLQLARTPGNKTSALEAIGRVAVDVKPPEQFAKQELPPLGPSAELKAKLDAVPPPEPKEIPVPEKKLGLDLA
ncbi:MAG: AAA family ATPase, partial [Sphingorhabdus sp.]|uniref:AAA family ATPase n=1 Tax=Sphingorhabdus sp. TaxID=1902408 RepID=UPI003C872653